MVNCLPRAFLIAYVPEFFRGLKIVITYRKCLYTYDCYVKKQFEKVDYEC